MALTPEQKAKRAAKAKAKREAAKKKEQERVDFLASLSDEEREEFLALEKKEAEEKKATEIAKKTKSEPKISIRAVIDVAGKEAINDAENLIEKLKDLEKFARANNRPARHFGIFANNILSFVRRFQKMLR